MYGMLFILPVLAAVTSALPTKRQELPTTSDPDLDTVTDALSARGLTDSDLFVCPASAPHGACSLEGNPYYVNEATTGDVVAGLFGVWECPTHYGESNITALCCADVSHESGDGDYTAWCDVASKTYLSTAELLALNTSSLTSSETPSGSNATSVLSLNDLAERVANATSNVQIEQLMERIEDAITAFDFATVQDKLQDALSKFDAAEIEAAIHSLTDLVDLDGLRDVQDELNADKINHAVES